MPLESKHLIETIRELSPGTSIVLMTGMANKEIQKPALEHGADAFIAKPFSLLNSRRSFDCTPIEKPWIYVGP